MTDDERFRAELEGQAAAGDLDAALLLEGVRCRAREACSACGEGPAGSVLIYRLDRAERERLGIVQEEVQLLFPLCDACRRRLGATPDDRARLRERVLRDAAAGHRDAIGVTFRDGR